MNKILLLLIVCFMVSSCFIIRKVEIRTDVNPELVESPVKVHLKNGQNVLFREGARFQGDRIYGDGELYSLDLELTERIEFLEMSDVAVYEVFSSKVKAVPTVLVSTMATALLTPPLLVAIFGSCPTVYHTDNLEPLLQAELFSNSIAPMLEKRDVVRLRAQPDEYGHLRLEIRNEALETHYINHIELLRVSHEQNEFVVPSNRNQPLTLSNFIKPNAVVSSLEGSISESVFNNGKHFYQSPVSAGISSEDDVLWDHVELTFDSPETDHVALHLNLRNTLYSTVLLYDFMLAARGQKALDWLGKELSTVSGAVALGSFSQEYLGLRVDLNVEGEYIEVGRIPNVGPISWKDVALELKDIPMNKPLQIRLRFLQDSWHIKNLRLATTVQTTEYDRIPLSNILSESVPGYNEILNRVNTVNDDYLITTPGTSLFFDFKTQIPGNNFNTYLLAAQGYYIEWIRPDWLEAPTYTSFPDYSPEMIVQSQNRWFQVKDEFEKQFFSTKIPVR